MVSISKGVEKVKESCYTIMAKSTREIGKQINVMVMVLNHLQTEVRMMVNTAKTECKVKGNIHGLEVSFMKASFLIIISMAQGCGEMLRGIAILVNGAMEKLQALECILNRMEVVMKDCFKILLKAGRGLRSSSVEICIKEITKMASLMAMVSIFGPMAALTKVTSKMG